MKGEYRRVNGKLVVYRVIKKVVGSLSDHSAVFDAETFKVAFFEE